MTTKMANWFSEHDQIIKLGLSDGRRAKFLSSAIARSYDWPQNGDYLGNVGLNSTALAGLYQYE